MSPSMAGRWSRSGLTPRGVGIDLVTATPEPGQTCTAAQALLTDQATRRRGAVLAAQCYTLDAIAAVVQIAQLT